MNRLDNLIKLENYHRRLAQEHERRAQENWNRANELLLEIQAVAEKEQPDCESDCSRVI